MPYIGNITQDFNVNNAMLDTDSVTSIKIVDGTIEGADIAANLDLSDTQKIRLGAGNDLQIYHDGSNSHVRDSGTGNLNLDGSQINIHNPTATEAMARFMENGAVELYYDNAAKIATTSTGVRVDSRIAGMNDANTYVNIGTSGNDQFQFFTGGNQRLFITGSPSDNGTVQLPADNLKLQIGAGQDIEIYHDGTNSFLTNNTNQFTIRNATADADFFIKADDIRLWNSAGNEQYLQANKNAEVHLYYDNSKKFETTSTGATVTGFLGINVASPDSPLEVGGTGPSLATIHHTDGGTNDEARIMLGALSSNPPDQRGAGISARNKGAGHDLEIQTSSTHSAGPSTKMTVTAGGNVQIANDSGRLQLGASQDLELYHNGTNSIINHTLGSGALRIQANDLRLMNNAGNEHYVVGFANDYAGLYFDNSQKFKTLSTGAKVIGQLNFDDGSSTANTNGIGMGTSQDCRIFHDGSSFQVRNTTGPVTFITPSHFQISADSSNDTMFKAIQDEGVKLYYDNSEKIETRPTGLRMQNSSTLDVNGGLIKFGHCSSTGSDDTLMFGSNGDDLEIFHGGNGHFDVNTGDVIIRNTGDFSSSREIFLMARVDEQSVTCFSDGAVELYYDNSKKFQTTSAGAQVTGALTLTSHLVMGASDEIKLGGSSQMTIWHSGSDFNMYNNTGQIIISNASGTGTGEGEIVFKTGNNNTRWRMTSGGDFIPAVNNSFAIGTASNRIAILYTQAAVNTSDKTLKNTITTSDLGLDFINKLKPVSYKWNQYEGEIADTRTHYGLIAQDVEEVITSSGKTLNDFGGVDKPDEGCMGLAYSQFISPLIKAVQELSAKVAALEAA